MIKALVINNKFETIVEINIYFDTLRRDICINAYYPLLHAMQFDARHFRYDAKESSGIITSTIMSFVKNIANESENRFIKGKNDLIQLLSSINYRLILENRHKTGLLY